MTALHQNAAAVVNSKTQLNGPDQVPILHLIYNYNSSDVVVKYLTEPSRIPRYIHYYYK
jgi:hypothetical protein